ncbi:MAG: phosphate acyltransferase PlsX [Acidobacteria bacterium]|nr:phosphate acyltransferase PlsX [Acidobacteriota bacterium]
MGGDHAPEEIVHGAILAATTDQIPVILTGDEAKLRSIAGSRLSPLIEIVHADEVIAMDDSSIRSILRKRGSSIHVAAGLVTEGRAGAFVSAGNTPAIWTIARRLLRMVEGVDRPALVAVIPRLEGFTVFLDVGANVDSRPHNLREFAVMGDLYAQTLMGIDNPRIGLLSNGEESGKGNVLTKETFHVLGATGINFAGNAEGNDLFSGDFDVIVTDGFIGNVVLKACESLAESMISAIRQELERSLRGQIGGLLAKPALKGLKKRIDYAEYGGAPLLGVQGGCIICHGRSDRRAIRNAIRVAHDFVALRVNEKIRERIGTLHTEERAEGLDDGSGKVAAVE